jgi:hypothetical protein
MCNSQFDAGKAYAGVASRRHPAARRHSCATALAISYCATNSRGNDRAGSTGQLTSSTSSHGHDPINLADSPPLWQAKRLRIAEGLYRQQLHLQHVSQSRTATLLICGVSPRRPVKRLWTVVRARRTEALAVRSTALPGPVRRLRSPRAAVPAPDGQGRGDSERAPSRGHLPVDIGRAPAPSPAVRPRSLTRPLRGRRRDQPPPRPVLRTPAAGKEGSYAPRNDQLRHQSRYRDPDLRRHGGRPQDPAGRCHSRYRGHTPSRNTSEGVQLKRQRYRPTTDRWDRQRRADREPGERPRLSHSEIPRRPDHP